MVCARGATATHRTEPVSTEQRKEDGAVGGSDWQPVQQPQAGGKPPDSSGGSLSLAHYIWIAAAASTRQFRVLPPDGVARAAARRNRLGLERPSAPRGSAPAVLHSLRRRRGLGLPQLGRRSCRPTWRSAPCSFPAAARGSGRRPTARRPISFRPWPRGSFLSWTVPSRSSVTAWARSSPSSSCGSCAAAASGLPSSWCCPATRRQRVRRTNHRSPTSPMRSSWRRCSGGTTGSRRRCSPRRSCSSSSCRS